MTGRSWDALGSVLGFSPQLLTVGKHPFGPVGDAGCGTHTSNCEEVVAARSPHSCFQVGTGEGAVWEKPSQVCHGERPPALLSFPAARHLGSRTAPTIFFLAHGHLVFLHQSLVIALLGLNQDF